MSQRKRPRREDHGFGTDSYEFRFDSKYVRDLIFELMFDDDETVEDAKEKSMKMYQEDGDDYVVTIKNRVAFNLVVSLASRGLSFRAIYTCFTSFRQYGNAYHLKGWNRMRIQHSIRIACTMTLHAIKLLMASAWGFAMALDVGSGGETQYLDIRIRVPFRSSYDNFRLLASPLFSGNSLLFV
jgi:hypothetical protein